MALLKTPANTPENNEGMTDRSAIPAGQYLAAIRKSEMKPTKAGTGHYLMLQIVILEGQYKGKTIFSNLNLDNPSPVAREIANKELNTICQACNKEGVEDSEELHGIPMTITVKVDKATSEWPESNSITNYENESEYDGEIVSEAPLDKPEEENEALPWEK